MKVGVLQFEPKFGAFDENLILIETAITTQLDLLILPELCTSGYQFVTHAEVAAIADEIPGGTVCQRLMRLAQKMNGCIVAGLAERDGNRFYNSAVAVNPNGIIGKYRKVHLFFEEKDFFMPGDLPLPVYDLGIAKIGVMICFDWIFPEAARTLSIKGAEILCLPTNLVLPYCQKAMITRAIENQVFTIVANRIGTEARGGKPPLHFTGGSQISDPKGIIIAAAATDQQELLVVEIQPELARNKWITPRNHLFQDRRSEFYEL